MIHLTRVAPWSLIISSTDEIISSVIYKINYRNGDSEEKIINKILEGCIYSEKYFNGRVFTEYNWIT